EHGSLNRFVGSNALVLHNTEIAVVLAVFLAIRAAQKHDSGQTARNCEPREDTWSSLCTFPSRPDAEKELSQLPLRKTRVYCESQASSSCLLLLPLITRHHAILDVDYAVGVFGYVGFVGDQHYGIA